LPENTESEQVARDTVSTKAFFVTIFETTNPSGVSVPGKRFLPPDFCQSMNERLWKVVIPDEGKEMTK
jgi:hypothetical protein